MVIEILGSGCANCGRLESLAEQAVAELGLDADVVHITDIADILSRGVMSTPALVVDGKVKFAGRVPSSAEVVSALRSA